MKQLKTTLLAAALCAATAGACAQTVVTIGGTTYVVHGLVGVGRLAADTRDVYGETFGSISGLWADRSSWSRQGQTYTGSFLAAPDRGYNVSGTVDYAPRLNQISLSFTPAALGVSGLSQNQISLSLTGSTQLFEMLPSGATRPLSGLDPVPGGVATGGARASAGSQPELPQAHNGKLALDAEGVVVLADGSRLVSDEYGPSVYRFSASGAFMGALPVAPSVRPVRNGVTDYSSNNPAAGQPAPSPANPTRGRANNQGFEGLSLSPDGRTLFVALQSAARQDLGSPATATRDHTRLFSYDLSNLDDIRLSGEYVIKLPKFQQGTSTLVAAQSEIHAVSDTQLLILPRDGNGLNTGTQVSQLRRVDVIDISSATNILNHPSEAQITAAGTLKAGITPVTYQAFLDINNPAELARFGLTNGVAAGLDNLSEKWEGLALLPALDPNAPNDYFLFVANDNDFITTRGFHAGAAYNGGFENDTMFLAWRVTVTPVPEPTTALLMIGGLAALMARRRRAEPARLS